MSAKGRFVRMALASGAMKKLKNGKFKVIDQDKLDSIKSRFGMWKAGAKKRKNKRTTKRKKK